jgi:hypothetical protein
MKRTVEKGEGRALTGAVERASGRQLRPALDVARRQGTQRARDLGGSEVRQVALLDPAEPRVDGVLN